MSEQSPRVNPWLTKGSSHLFKGTDAKQPINDISCVEPQSPFNNSAVKDYSIRPSSKQPLSDPEERLSMARSFLHQIMNSIKSSSLDSLLSFDYTVFENYSTVGLANEGNNCYQNSVIQVRHMLCSFSSSAYFIFPFFSLSLLIFLIV